MYDQGRVTNQPEGKFPLGFVRQVLLCVCFFQKKKVDYRRDGLCYPSWIFIMLVKGGYRKFWGKKYNKDDNSILLRHFSMKLLRSPTHKTCFSFALGCPQDFNFARQFWCGRVETGLNGR